MFKVELKSQNLTTTFRNTIAVFYHNGAIYENFGPCAHVLPAGWIYIMHEHDKREIVNSFLHIEGILSGKNNVLTLFSGRILQTTGDLINKVQDKLHNEHWKEFIDKRLHMLDNKGWFGDEFAMRTKRGELG